jgi:sugar phosphate permease
LGARRDCNNVKLLSEFALKAVLYWIRHMSLQSIDRSHDCTDASLAERRWLVLALAWAAFAVSTICRLAWGTVALSVSQSLDLPIAALGTFATAFAFGYIASNAVSGMAADIFGGRRALTISLAGLALVTYGFGHTPSLMIGLALQALMGFAAGADYSAGVKLVSVYFPQHERGRAIGLFMTASSVAVIVTSAILPSVVAAYGWRSAYHFLGVAVIITSILCLYFIRDVRTVQETGPHAKAPGVLRRIRRIATPNFFLLAIAGCGASWGALGFLAWAIPLMVKGHGLTTVQAGFVISIAGVAGLFSKPIIGWLSDRIGGRRKALSILSFAYFAIVLIVFGQLSTLTAFQVAAPLVGIGVFVYSPLLVAMVAEEATPRHAGSAAGIANAVWQLGSAIAPAAVGIIFQWTQSFSVCFATLAAGPLVAVISMLFVREVRGRQR